MNDFVPARQLGRGALIAVPVSGVACERGEVHVFQIIDRGHDVFDAVVVGSGATGGWAAKQLAEAGMKVAVLEAGSRVTPADFTEHVQPYQLPYRGRSPDIARDRPIQSLTRTCGESNYKWFVNDIQNPYTTPDDKPFHWIRMRVLGGRSLGWGRQSYRMGDIDFKAADRDGYGENWPISYRDLVPHYETVEKFIGISGQAEGLPQLPDSVFLPPMGMTCPEQHLRQTLADKMGRVMTIGRTAILTREHNGRAACHYCGPCHLGCVTNSYYSSPFTTLAAAQDSGNLTIITDAVASHITTDRRSGLASGVAYIDRESRTARELRAKIVVLCASTLESTRLLLNSAPGGLANSSGVLGHYLMDHIYRAYVFGDFPDIKSEPWFGPPVRPNGIYVPRFFNVAQAHTDGIIRGFGYQGGGFQNFPFEAPGFGAQYKHAVRSNTSWTMRLSGFSECLPRYDNHVAIDRSRVDSWGIPTLRIQMQWSDNELKLWDRSRSEAATMLEAAGAKNIRMLDQPSVPGFAIHELGTARMGSDPNKSVLNANHQSHDVKNLFVTDGAAFVTSACQNPTLTMMANTVRACDYIVDQGRKGNLG